MIGKIEDQVEIDWRLSGGTISTIICPISEKIRWTHLCSDRNLFFNMYEEQRHSSIFYPGASDSASKSVRGNDDDDDDDSDDEDISDAEKAKRRLKRTTAKYERSTGETMSSTRLIHDPLAVIAERGVPDDYADAGGSGELGNT